MNFKPRDYPAIVRDLLTSLTKGTVRETVTVPGVEGPIILKELANRPLRRVSHLQGKVSSGDENDTEGRDFRFTSADFELISSTGGEEFDAIRFREGGNRPLPGSELSVNYFPVNIDPMPVTDLNVGSVVRTILESLAVELTLEEQLLERVYKSAFLETAENQSLDKVVALVGVKRIPSGVPTAKIRFVRATGTVGRITIPVGTRMSDVEGKNLYQTVAPLILEPGESSREINAVGINSKTEAVPAGALTRLEMMIAGVGSVTNPTEAWTRSDPETDESLRRRARGALHKAIRGTLDALKFGILSIEGVQDVALQEFPNGVPGEVKIDVVYEQNADPALQDQVQRRIDELRPAGIRVLLGQAAKTKVTVQVEITLAGTGVPDADLEPLKKDVEARLAEFLGKLSPGGVARQAQMVATVMSDSRIVDAKIELSADGGPQVDKLELATGHAIDLTRPFSFLQVKTEDTGGSALATTAEVDLTLPVHLEPGVTQSELEQTIRLAAQAHMNSLVTSATPYSIDSLAAAIRDDTRFTLIRAEALSIVESQGRFIQLADQLGEYTPQPNETLHLRDVILDVREGGN
ncbi:MAG: baseplate J/gp47 family protein [Nitrospina sp.]|nr:baseplate J/gp47 family protein [Nitrospina sp.]